MHDVLREVFEIERAGEMGELVRESRIRHRKVKLQSGDEMGHGKPLPGSARVSRVGDGVSPSRTL
jgi:hypothetical protein